MPVDPDCRNLEAEVEPFGIEEIGAEMCAFLHLIHSQVVEAACIRCESN